MPATGVWRSQYRTSLRGLGPAEHLSWSRQQCLAVSVLTCPRGTGRPVTRVLQPPMATGSLLNCQVLVYLCQDSKLYFTVVLSGINVSFRGVDTRLPRLYSSTAKVAVWQIDRQWLAYNQPERSLNVLMSELIESVFDEARW